MVAGTASVKVAAGAGQEISPAEVAAGAPSVEVAADAYPANEQGPEADGWPDDNVSLAPTDPEAPPISVGCAQSIEPTVAERIAQGWCNESCVRGRGGCVRGRSRDHPHRRRQDQMRDTQHKSFSATILLQRGERRTSYARKLALSCGAGK